MATLLGVAALMSERIHRYFAASWILVVGLVGTLYLMIWPYVVRPVLLASDAVTMQTANAWLAAGFAGLAVLAVAGLYVLERWAGPELQ